MVGGRDFNDDVLLTEAITAYVSLNSPRDPAASEKSSGKKMQAASPDSSRNDYNSQIPYSNVTCFAGHRIRFFPSGYRKQRKDGRGKIIMHKPSSFRCKGCQNLFMLGAKGYYSCDKTCDFDLCFKCMTCHIDGNLLSESFTVPSQDTIKWQNFCKTNTQENYFDASTNSNTTEMNNGPLS